MNQSISSSSNHKKITPDLALMNDHIKNILVTISQNPVTNVISLTGTGKTTKLPVGIAKAGNRIVVVVSDSGIASSLANYVGSTNDLSISNEIGSSSKLSYISESDMKKYIYNIVKSGGCLDLDFADVLMIDQADIGSLDQFLIMALWRYCAERRARVPRLLLVSNNEIKSDQFDIEPYIVESVMYPVEIRYTGKDYNSNDLNDQTDDITNLVFNLHYSSLDGDMLIFTTGKLQIESLIKHLKALQLENVNIYPAHSDLTIEEIDRIYQDTSNRKIIVADRLAETTFTLNKLSVIIDTMMDHRPELSLTGGQRYPKRYITKNQANLRSNRGGRFGPVLSYRMIAQALYNKLLEDVDPEIYRTPLHYIMLELIENNIDPFQVLDMCDQKILDRMYKLMLNLGLINTLGKITPVGIFVTKIPYGIRQAVALYRWLENKYPPYPAIVLLSMIDSFGKSYYVYPMRDGETSHAEYNLELLEHRKEYFEPFEGKSDVHTYGNIWSVMVDEVGGPEVPSTDIREWCSNNWIRYENISEVLFLTQKIINILNKTRSENIEIGPFDTNNLMDLLSPILIDIYSDKRFSLDNHTEIKVRYVGNDMKYYKIDSQDSINSIEMDPPSVVFGLVTATISSKYTSDFHTLVVTLVE